MSHMPTNKSALALIINSTFNDNADHRGPQSRYSRRVHPLFAQVAPVAGLEQSLRGPSIYDVHTKGGGGIRLRWTHMDRGWGLSPMWTSIQKIKIKSPLTSSCLLLLQRSWHIFYQNFVFGLNKKWKFFSDINY